ncbi:hypothetical protein [Rhizobium etli]|nr:hypothetical protein [Rhizobium etli]
MTGETVVLELAALVMLQENQIREKTDRHTVRRYAEQMAGGAKFPPVKVTLTDPTNETKGYTLVDGWHRVEATKVNGGGTIVADVVAARPEEIAWFAVVANRAHGLQLKLTREVRRGVFRAYVRAGKHRTGRGRKVKAVSEMAQDLTGIVSRRQIPSWMAADFPAIYKAMNGNGLEGQDLGGHKERDMDEEYAKAAQAALNEFSACMRAMNDNRKARRVLTTASAHVLELAAAVTGKREWPRAAVVTADDF